MYWLSILPVFDSAEAGAAASLCADNTGVVAARGLISYHNGGDADWLIDTNRILIMLIVKSAPVTELNIVIKR